MEKTSSPSDTIIDSKTCTQCNIYQSNNNGITRKSKPKSHFKMNNLASGSLECTHDLIERKKSLNIKYSKKRKHDSPKNSKSANKKIKTSTLNCEGIKCKISLDNYDHRLDNKPLQLDNMNKVNFNNKLKESKNKDRHFKHNIKSSSKSPRSESSGNTIKQSRIEINKRNNEKSKKNFNINNLNKSMLNKLEYNSSNDMIVDELQKTISKDLNTNNISKLDKTADIKVKLKLYVKYILNYI